MRALDSAGTGGMGDTPPPEVVREEVAQEEAARSTGRSLLAGLRWLASVVSFAAVIVAALFLISWLLFGSIAGGVHWLQGKPLALENSTLNFEPLGAGEQQELAFVVVNRSFGPVHLLGSNASCGCVKIHSLPREIPAREAVEIPVTITALPGLANGEVHSQTVIFHTDLQSQPRLRASVRGRMVAD